MRRRRTTGGRRNRSEPSLKAGRRVEDGLDRINVSHGGQWRGKRSASRATAMARLSSGSGTARADKADGERSQHEQKTSNIQYPNYTERSRKQLEREGSKKTRRKWRRSVRAREVQSLRSWSSRACSSSTSPPPPAAADDGAPPPSPMATAVRLPGSAIEVGGADDGVSPSWITNSTSKPVPPPRERNRETKDVPAAQH